MRLPHFIVLALALSASANVLAASLKPYREDAELAGALESWRKASLSAARERAHWLPGMAQSMVAPTPMAPAAPVAAAAGANAAAEIITTVQTVGVDEGGIVKCAGDHLIILRRWRLFTVRVGGEPSRPKVQPISQIDAYAPGSDPRVAWYDELLISGSTVVVVGYSCARGGTEIGLFELGDNGSLAYRAPDHLRSFDYCSARDCASRLIGQRLVFCTPTVLQPLVPPWAPMMPALRRWSGQAAPSDFERILPAMRVFRTDDEFDAGQPLALHTVTSCELDAAVLRCDSTAVLGPVGRVFYASADSVCVWTNGTRRAAVVDREPTTAPLSAVFRLPPPAGRQRAQRPEDRRGAHRPDGVPGRLARPSQRTAARAGRGRRHVRCPDEPRPHSAVAAAAVGLW